MAPITLIPLSAEHAAPLQAVYVAAPRYWAHFGLDALPPDQATRDLAAAADDPTRSILGILQRVQPDNPSAGQQMIGAVDMRRHYPAEQDVTVGLLIVAEPYQRQGIGRAAWALLEGWLAQQPGLSVAHLAIEQFNLPALHFFTALGYELTGHATRQKVNNTFVRYLAMQKLLPAQK
jgi:RimJ/RimL family protein N-acetyltransferase